MIGELKPHAAYKDSGHDWLGSAPAHWSIDRIKTVLSEIDRRSVSGREPLLSLRMQVGLVDHHAAGGRPIPPSALIGYKRVMPGEIVMNRMRAAAGLFAVASTEGLVSPDYAVFRVNPRLNQNYAVQLFKTPAMAYVFRTESTGLGTGESGFLRLYSDQFGRLAIPIPPLEEQAAIVRFLDWANGRLERAIRAKRKVIALLTEQKQALSERCISGGLMVGAPLKPAGVSWLGDIPAHWEVSRLKHGITRIEQGWSPQCDAQPAGDGQWGVLKVGCVNKESFAADQNKKLPDALRPDPGLEVRDGDILVSRANTSNLLGLAALAEKPRPRLMLSDKLFRFRVKASQFDSVYLVAALRAKASRAQIESSTNGASSSMQNIGQSVLGNLWLAVPPIGEQRAIVAHIATECRPLTKAIDRLEAEISLIREYRTRLVADVVTGRLDVQAVAAGLPDEAGWLRDAEPVDPADDTEPADEEGAEA